MSSSSSETPTLLWVVLAVLAVVVLLPALMMAVSMPMMGWWWNGAGPGRGISPLWGVGAMLVPLLVVLGVGYVLYRGIAGTGAVGRDPALEELRAAYARGELSDEEFERRRQRLERDRE